MQIECTERLHELEENFKIPYNFLIGGDGIIYVGLGWNLKGYCTAWQFSNETICVAFIGNFDKKAPPKQHLEFAQLLLGEGVKLNKLEMDYKVHGECQMNSYTNSPGLALFNEIKQWKEHYSSIVKYGSIERKNERCKKIPLHWNE